MKRLFSFLCAVVMLMSVIGGSALALEPEEKIIDLGDGFYFVETLTQSPMRRSGDEVYGAKSGNIYYDSTLIGIATLAASFDISGTTAVATRAAIDGEGRSGCTYVKGTTRVSGNKATGTATFKFEGVEKRLTLSISCSPSGELS